MKCKTHFGFFDHRRFLVDQLWPDRSRDSVVKTASYLMFIEVQTLNFGLKYGHFRYHELQKCPNSKNYFVTAHLDSKEARCPVFLGKWVTNRENLLQDIFGGWQCSHPFTRKNNTK